MAIIWSIIAVYGFVSMLMLVLGLWTHLDTRKLQEEEKFGEADARSQNEVK
jgi:hypothetical protein